MEQWTEIRRRVLKEGVSKRQILRETGMHWRTLEKILDNSSPPGYRRSKSIRKPKIEPWLGRIEEMLKEDKGKQYHSAKKILERLQKEGFTGGYTIVKEAVRQIKKRGKEVFMPLSHPPGEAQVDFGNALVKMDGVLRKIAFFVMALPYSDGFFVMAFDHECTETFWEGHVRAFDFFDGAPNRISYDNSKVMISQIIGPRKRKLTDGFLQLVSHYLFDYHFCLVRRANEKGVVEGIVKFSRLNFMVPVPQVKDFDELNEYLAQMCREDLNRRLRGGKATKAELLQEDQSCFRPLPAIPFDACRIEFSLADSESLVRFDRNDYSVPVEYAYHDITVKGYVDRVELYYKQDLAAIHDRCWDRERKIFNPVHYLPLLERKPHGLDYGRPFEDFVLPGCFQVLRDRLEADPDKGLREFIRVLRLLERYTLVELTAAVEKVMPLGAVGADVIGLFVQPPQSWEFTTFCLAGREHLRQVKVESCQVSDYSNMVFCSGGVQ